ncbi:MAG: hypothetical protein JXR15_04255 [Shimia sp.]|uniref:hypothetical protein n=1 Tax=Shimia sp. TaxID=1954381 RepID=UPI003B8CB279
MKVLATPVILALALGGCMSSSGDEATVMDSLIGKELVTEAARPSLSMRMAPLVA